MSQTLLTLAPEQGGQRFGPFTGTITLGSDAGRCQVVLHPSTGAQPVHALLTDTGTGWQLQPAAVGCALSVRQTSGRMMDVTTAVTIQAGDTIVIGGPSGAALTVQRMAARPGAGAASGGPRVPGSQHLSGSAFGREIWRQIELFLVTMPYGRDVYRFLQRFRSGAMFRPRYIIGAAVAVLVFVCGGCFTGLSAVGVWLGLR